MQLIRGAYSKNQNWDGGQDANTSWLGELMFDKYQVIKVFFRPQNWGFLEEGGGKPTP